MSDRSLECVGSGWMHDYKIIAQDRYESREVCRKCHKEKIFSKVNNNKEYYDHHRRDFLQQGDRRFEREYGKETD